jgi:hypothetical protein
MARWLTRGMLKARGMVGLFPFVIACSGAPAGEEDEGAVGVEREAAVVTNVGVIPMDGQACPAGTEVSFYLDIEDLQSGEVIFGPEAGFRTEWVAPDVAWNQAPFTLLAGGGFSMRFCRVDGNQFKTMLVGGDVTAYATLALSSICPNGSFRASRYIDCEDDDNENHTSGVLSPTAVDRNANLVFCVFGSALGGNGPYMSSFPTLNGISHYAVFHDFDMSPQPSWILKKQYIFSDDEDDNNENSRNPAATTGLGSTLAKMIEGTDFTYIEYGQVR